MARHYRLMIDSPTRGKSFIVRGEGRQVHYVSDSETPLCLSNLLGHNAAQVRFALEDARTPAEARSVVENTLRKQWERNMPAKPTVRIIDDSNILEGLW
jgi:hypothetical protein